MADLEAAQGILARDVNAMKGELAALTDSFKDMSARQYQILQVLLAANARNLDTPNANANANDLGGPSARQNVNQGIPVVQNNVGDAQEDDQEDLFGYNPFDVGTGANQFAE